ALVATPPRNTFPKDSKPLRTAPIPPCNTHATRDKPDVLVMFGRPPSLTGPHNPEGVLEGVCKPEAVRGCEMSIMLIGFDLDHD
ncbi:MAG TPA: hypothetical protein PKV67_18060, partial [Hyphomonas sp.]|nr:hypothetical protein [Hyphomonas sp.]